jgi:hypothetical protein
MTPAGVEKTTKRRFMMNPGYECPPKPLFILNAKNHHRHASDASLTAVSRQATRMAH